MCQRGRTYRTIVLKMDIKRDTFRLMTEKYERRHDTHSNVGDQA
jgi:hypothetical protein